MNNIVKGNLRITPKEFTRIWNLLLVAYKKGEADNGALYWTVLTIEGDLEMYSKFSFIADRVNKDPDFQRTVCRKTNQMAVLSVTHLNNQIQVIANRIEAR